MRARSARCRVLLAHRPFAGALGASLYVGTPDGPGIRYRRNKPVCPGVAWWPVSDSATIDPGAASVPKSQRVGVVTSPTESIDYTLPAELLGVTVACQVRTYAADYENETIYRPQLIVCDGSGDETNTILGTVTVLGKDKLDGGGMRLRFAYQSSRSGVQPDQFALVQTSGPGSLPDVVIDASDRLLSIDVTGLTDATAYGWRLEGRAGATSTSLATITFTADAAGPPAVSNLTAVEA